MSVIVSGNLKSIMKQEMYAIHNDVDTINDKYEEVEKDIQIIKRNLARKSWKNSSKRSFKNKRY